MTRFLLTLSLALAVASCTPGTVVTPTGDCDDCPDGRDTDTDSDADTDTDSDSDADADSDTDSDTDADADSDTDSDSDSDSDSDADLRITVTTPGGAMYGSMLCHVEFLEDTDGDGSFYDEFWGWEYSWVENWVSQTTLEADPGMIDAVRLNCTLCPDELTLAEEPWSPEAEAMGCTWTAVNGSGSTNGSVATWYFGETFGSSLVSVAGGTSVLVDLR